MERVAVRQLKARLSEYLGKVKAGEAVIVTERGRSIAKLVPFPAGDGLPERLMEMERQGLVRVGSFPVSDEFWASPRVQDPQGRGVEAILSERSEEP